MADFERASGLMRRLRDVVLDAELYVEVLQEEDSPGRRSSNDPWFEFGRANFAHLVGRCAQLMDLRGIDSTEELRSAWADFFDHSVVACLYLKQARLAAYQAIYPPEYATKASETVSRCKQVDRLSFPALLGKTLSLVDELGRDATVGQSLYSLVAELHYCLVAAQKRYLLHSDYEVGLKSVLLELQSSASVQAVRSGESMASTDLRYPSVASGPRPDELEVVRDLLEKLISGKDLRGLAHEVNAVKKVFLRDGMKFEEFFPKIQDAETEGDA